MENIETLFELIKDHKYDKFNDILENDTNNMIDVNIRDNHNNYLLTYAIIYNNKSLVSILLKKGAQIDITDNDDRSILYIAIKFDFIDIIKILLEHNKSNVGISILDIRDKNMNIPLHYAIAFSNMKAIKLLIEYGSNINITDKYGNNSVHLGVYSRNYDIADLLLSYTSEINARTNTGESVLHIACNLQLYDIAKLILSKPNININIQDYEHEFTPLHYCVNLGNKDLIKLLIDDNAILDIQDLYGNTPLHYILIESNLEYYNLFVDSKNKINFNLWNLEGKIPLHMLLDNRPENIDSFFPLILKKSNYNIQDIDGNTPLHGLCDLLVWKKYSDIFVTKRLDIAVKNKKEIRPIDLINKEDIEEFMNIVVKSYLYRLRRNKTLLWTEEWENICKYDFGEQDENNIKKKHTDNECEDIIRKKIKEVIKDTSKCSYLSYPRTKGYICPNITSDNNLTICTFTGSTLDILMGLIYLLQKHKSTCSTINKNFMDNNELCKFYRTMGINMNTRCEFLNFEVVWVYNKLYLTKEFHDNFRKCMNNKNKRYVIVPLGIEIKEGSHANYLIYDKITKEIERFEPHGSSTPPGFNYNTNLLDKLLESRIKEIDPDLIYISPSQYLPKIGFQLLDISESKRKRIGDPGGFCALWAIWYVDMRITYPDIPRKKLVNRLINQIKKQNISFKNMIRTYASDIINIRDNILNKQKVDINEWILDQPNDVQLANIIKDIIGIINKLQN
jgi:ankyrin repeat protein